jgi:chromosome segregation ATPase
LPCRKPSRQTSEDFNLIGTLAESIQVEERWERAVEGVFGPSLQSTWGRRLMLFARGWLKSNRAVANFW